MRQVNLKKVSTFTTATYLIVLLIVTIVAFQVEYPSFLIATIIAFQVEYLLFLINNHELSIILLLHCQALLTHRALTYILPIC